MEYSNLSEQIQVRRPFVKMQIEKVSLRTTETMGEYCQTLSSGSSQGSTDPACSVQIGGCQV